MTPPYFGFTPDDLRRIETESPLASLDFHESLGSTNDRALALVREQSVEVPALVLAADQTAGRGRGANQWHSGPGALTFSLALEPPAALSASRLSIVSLIAGLSVCETLAEFLPPDSAIGLKWPNDVLLDGRKVCGILVESIATPNRRLVIGVGLNVNNELPKVEGFRQQPPTSLASAADRQFGLADVLIELLARLDQHIASMADANESWLEPCRQYCMLTGRTVRIDTQNHTDVGLCQGIGPDGALLLEQNGTTKSVYSGTVAEVE